MAFRDDLRQSLVLVLQKQGTENIDQLKALANSFKKGEGNLLEFNRATGDLIKHYNLVVGLLAQVDKEQAANAQREGKAIRDRIDGWAAAYDAMDRYQAKLKSMEQRTQDERGESEAARRLKEEQEAAQQLAAYHAKLKQMAEDSAKARADAEAQATAALRAGQQQMAAYMQSMDEQKQADIEQMGRRARMKAQFERDVDEAIEARKMEVGAEKRARIEAYAAQEEAAEKANRAAKQQMGDAIRAAAERHARIDAFNEEEHKKTIARIDAENKASESLANQKMLYARAAAKDLNDNQIKELKRLTESIVDVNKFTDESIQKFNLVGNGMNSAEQKSKNFAMGLMAVAHAAQDAQYGFGAVVNNIPQIAYAMGNAIPSMEKYAMQFSAIAMIGGTLVNIALPHIKQFVTTFATELGLITDPLRTAAVTTDQLKTKIEALQSKSWKVDLDYRLIADAQKQMSDLESRLRSWDAIANSRTSIEQESGKRFGEMVSENTNPQAFKEALMDALGKMGRLKLGTKEESDLKSAEHEMKLITDRLQDPKTDAQERAIQLDRKLTLELLMAPMRDAVRKQVQAKLDGILGGAAQGRIGDFQDIQAAFAFSPDSFKARGMDLQKIAAGLMGASHDVIRDEKENAKEAAKQEAQAKREKRLRDDQTDDLNRQGKEHDAAVKPLIEGAKARRDMVARQWQEANTQQMDAAEKHLKDAPKVEARAQRAAAAKTRAEQAAERRQKAAFGRHIRDLDKENEERSIREFAQDFRNAGFDAGFATMGARQVAGQIKAGKGEEQAMIDVYRKLLETVSKQERTLGMMGQATVLLHQLEERMKGVDMMMQRQGQMMQRVGNKRKTLLLPPGQGG